MVKGSRHSIYIGPQETLLANAMMQEDETFSAFVQRLIKTEAERQGLSVQIKVVKGGEND